MKTLLMQKVNEVVFHDLFLYSEGETPTNFLKTRDIADASVNPVRKAIDNNV